MVKWDNHEPPKSVHPHLEPISWSDAPSAAQEYPRNGSPYCVGEMHENGNVS
jgi:hypothetical protein